MDQWKKNTNAVSRTTRTTRAVINHNFIRFSCSPSEDFLFILRPLRSSIGLSTVPNGQRQYLRLRKQARAQQFYKQMPHAVQTDFEESLRLLRYIEPDQTEILHLRFPQKNSTRGTPSPAITWHVFKKSELKFSQWQKKSKKYSKNQWNSLWISRADNITNQNF